MKKIPDARPNWAAVKPMSRFIPLGPAKAMAVRSRKLMKNISATKGTRRIETLRMAVCSVVETVFMRAPLL